MAMTVRIVFLFVLASSPAVLSLCTMETPCKNFTEGLPFSKPREQVSSGGSLTTNIEVGMATFTLDWLSSQRRLYNGSFPGPTLRVKAGDNVKVDLHNTLQQPDFVDAPLNSFHNPNTTNVHTHGLHISSLEPQDNVLITIAPDTTYHYSYEFHPQQASGTYWYHPHFHGSGYFQNLGGMAGMLIVEDDPQTMSPQLDAASCPNNCERDIPMVLQLFQYSTVEDGSYSQAQSDIQDNEAFRLKGVSLLNEARNLEQWLEDPANEVQHVLVNGQLRPRLEMKVAQFYRFRLLNAGGLHAYAAHVTDLNGYLSKCTVKEIALDGHYLDAPRDQRLGRSLLVAAGRVDWLVYCTEAGDFELRSTFAHIDELSMGEHPSYTGLLVNLAVTGESATGPGNFPATLPPRPAYLKDLRNVSPKDVCGKFVVEVTPTDTLNREDYTESIKYRSRVGTIQEWHLTNTEYETSHPIHIHINSFQIISYNKYTGPYGVDDGGSNWKLFNQDGETCKWQHSQYNESVQISSPINVLEHLGHDENQQEGGAGTIGYAQIGDWMDTILVPPLSNITIRFQTDTYTGIVLVHCHLLADAEQGMTLLAEIVEEGASLEADSTSAGSYQWSCMENNPVDRTTCGSCATLTHSATLMVICVLLNVLRLS